MGTKGFQTLTFVCYTRVYKVLLLFTTNSWYLALLRDLIQGDDRMGKISTLLTPIHSTSSSVGIENRLRVKFETGRPRSKGKTEYSLREDRSRIVCLLGVIYEELI